MNNNEFDVKIFNLYMYFLSVEIMFLIVYCLSMKYLFAAEIYQWCKSLHRVKNNFQEHYNVNGKFCFFSFIYLLIEVLSCLK